MRIPRNVAVPSALIAPTSVLLAGCGRNLFEMAGSFWSLSCCGVVIVVLDVLALIEIAGSARSTGDKVLWAVLIIIFPVVGVLAYYFIGRRR